MTRKSGPEVGIWSRSRKLLGAAGKIAAKEAQRISKQAIAKHGDIAGIDLRTKIEQATVLAESLSELKGAAMKAGQLLSLDASDLLPEEVALALRKLQNQATPVPFEVLESVLIEDLGPEKVQQIQNLNPSAHASASIGQVHTGTIHGQEVAIKIQYPRITESIDSDLLLLRKLTSGYLGLTGKDIEMKALFDELSSVLKLEGNYEHELQCILRYQEAFRSDPHLKVPNPLPEFSSKRVLTMSFESGETLQHWIQNNPEKAKRIEMGHRLLDLYCKEFFEHGLVQTDPNPANFLVQKSALVLLDFGATITYDDGFRARYIELLRTFSTKNKSDIILVGIEQNLIDSRESDESKQLFAEMLIQSVEPFEQNLQPFVFADKDYARRARDTGFAFVRSLKYSPPPHAILFLHRKLGGIFNLLKRMDIELDLVPYWNRMVQERR